MRADADSEIRFEEAHLKSNQGDDDIFEHGQLLFHFGQEKL